MSNPRRSRLVWITTLALLMGCVRAASLPTQDTPLATLPQPVSTPQTTASSSPAAPSPSGVAEASQPTLTSPHIFTPRPPVTEQEVQLIELAGPIQSAEAEISGMTWYQDTLILLPQYPERFQDERAEGYVFGIKKDAILAYIDGSNTQPITPQPIPFITNDLGRSLRDYEGFESIAVAGDQAYLTIETSPGATLGYLVQANILAEMQAIVVNSAVIVEIPSQINSPNHSYESLVVFGRRLVAIHEINGAKTNPAPSAPIFGLDLSLIDSLRFPSIEYRITDASQVDENGRFWVINYFFPGDLALYADDPLAAEYGRGETHQQGVAVERLLELQFSESGIELAPGGYLLLKLDTAARNWEGLARLDQLGFLIATDKFPRTLLGYVEFPTPP